MRIVRGFVWLVTFVLTVAAVLGALGVHLTMTGKSALLVREAASRLDRVIEGQRTRELELSLRLRPAMNELSASATIVVRAEEASRRYFYFLLNDGFSIRRVSEEQAGSRAPLRFYSLSLLRVIDLGRELNEGEEARIAIEYGGSPLGARLHLLGRPVFEIGNIVLPVDQLWYPADLQSFFTADLSVTLPAELELVHNGQEIARQHVGREVRVQWRVARPTPGLALVAGKYRQERHSVGDRRVRLYLPDGVELEPERVLSLAAGSQALFEEKFGPSGHPQITLFVNRLLARAFNDGTGLIGIPPERFQRGDYGARIIAHEIAHNWWGGTVAERWLRSGTGGEWVTEGFAEYSSWLAVERELGQAALVEARQSDFYDPQHTRVLAELGALDNRIDPAARATIYRKGAFVTQMLQRAVGEEKFFTAARQLLERHRYRAASDRDLQAVFEEVSGQDLEEFFRSWVRSEEHLDLTLEPDGGNAVVRNLSNAPVFGPLELWRFPPDGNPERQVVELGARTPIGNVESLILDPLAELPDMYRRNNLLPRIENPRAVARSTRGEWMVVRGEPYPWAPVGILHVGTDGRTRHSWQLDGGAFAEPTWSADGTQILAVQRDADGRELVVALNVTDGSQRIVARGEWATATADDILIASGGRLQRSRAGKWQTLIEHPGAQVIAPLASPDGERVAYAVASPRGLDLRVVGSDGADDRLLLAWHRSDLIWSWSPDGSRLFAALAGDWDWQLWELPLELGSPRRLAAEAAAIGDLAVAPDGKRVALVAAAELDYGQERRRVFVVEPTGGEVREVDLETRIAHDLAWYDDSALLVVTSDPITPALPVRRTLQRVPLDGGPPSPFGDQG